MVPILLVLQIVPIWGIAGERRQDCCAGAPPDLVQIVTGYAEAGNALVTGGVNKVIFVGSTGVGKAVMQVLTQSLHGLSLHLCHVCIPVMWALQRLVIAPYSLLEDTPSMRWAGA